MRRLRTADPPSARMLDKMGLTTNAELIRYALDNPRPTGKPTDILR